MLDNMQLKKLLSLSDEELRPLIQHEQNAQRKLKEQAGIRILMKFCSLTQIEERLLQR